MTPHVLTRLDTRPIPENGAEIRLFGFVHNECARMPFFLEYHRKLGVNRFILVDNDSDDGTREFLLAQPDCHVFFTRNSYREAKSGIYWTKALLDLYGTGHWCLLLDADELLVYPHCEKVGLRRFCDFLESEGSEALYTFLLDMYSDCEISASVCTSGKSFFEICSFFDRDYKFVERLHFGKKQPFPPQEVLGGPRARSFYPPQGENDHRTRLAIHASMQARHYLRHKFRLPVKPSRSKAPALFKVPLIRWQKHFAYTASTHELNPVKLSAVTGVLAHFKFFADFHERAERAVRKANFVDGSAEYRQYLMGMQHIKNGCFTYPGSQRYTSSEDLLALNLIKTSPAYEQQAGSGHKEK